jgi:hypothetical protein
VRILYLSHSDNLQSRLSALRARYKDVAAVSPRGRIAFDYDRELRKGGVLKSLAAISGECGLCLFVPALPMLENKSYDSVLTLNNGKPAGMYDRVSDAAFPWDEPSAGHSLETKAPVPSSGFRIPDSSAGFTLGRALKV